MERKRLRCKLEMTVMRVVGVLVCGGWNNKKTAEKQIEIENLCHKWKCDKMLWESITDQKRPAMPDLGLMDKLMDYHIWMDFKWFSEWIEGFFFKWLDLLNVTSWLIILS